MIHTQVPFAQIWLPTDVWWLHSVIPGKAYRFYGGNDCTHSVIQSQSQESQFLQDDDMMTCEWMPYDSRGMFGLFFNEPRRRLIFVSVYGKEILCSPVNGISLTITSTHREIHACKAYITGSVSSCNYECQCPRDKSCSHITVMISPTTFAGGMMELSEIKMWSGSQW